MKIIADTWEFCRENAGFLGARAALEGDGLSLWVRVGSLARSHPGAMLLQIAQIDTRPSRLRGHGLMTAWLDAVELLRPLHGVAFMSVMNPRLFLHLERRGYEEHGCMDMVKVWER